MKTHIVLSLLSLVLMASCKKASTNPPAGTLNPWDGKYRLEGSRADAKEPVYVWPGNTYLYNLETLSATQVKLIS